MEKGVVLPGTVAFDLAPHAGGAPYRIFLAIPPGPPPSGGFPVVHLLDANASFATLVEAQRRGAERAASTGIGAAVLVGIGYPAEGIYDRARRSFDYTAGPGAEQEAAPGTTGGRDAFLAFIETVLKPAVAARVPVDAGRQTLIGHSLAGGFVLDVFGHDTRCFSAYAAISPSLWWDEARLHAGLAQVSGGARLSVMVGEWEQALAPWQIGRPGAEAVAERRARRAMIDRARTFTEAARLALAGQGAAGGEVRFKVRFEVLAGEDHASVVPPALTRALRFALAEPSER